MPGPGEVGVRVVDPGVDHGDLDPLAVEAGEAVPGGRRPDQRHAVDVRRLHQLDRMDGDDARQGRERVGLARVDPHLDPVVRRLVVTEHLAAERLDLLLDRRLLRLDVIPPLLLLVFRERSGGTRVHDGDRIRRELDDHRRLLMAEAARHDDRRDVVARIGCRRGAGARDARGCEAQRDDERYESCKDHTRDGAVHLRCGTWHSLSSPPTQTDPRPQRSLPQACFYRLLVFRRLIVRASSAGVNTEFGGSSTG